MKPLGEEALDQAAHIAIGAIQCALILFLPLPIGCALATLITGLAREHGEGGDMFSSGSIRDLIAWAAGGLIIGLAIELTR